MKTLAPLKEKHLSYSGLHSSSPDVLSPTDLDELRQILLSANQEKRRVTLRGAGMSLDSHSIGEDLSIVMTHFNHIEVDEKAQTVTAGAGATWGIILTLLDPLGLVPRVLVTTKRATVGGTLSTNALSRFSCIHGREGVSILSLKLMTADGTLHTCSRDENPTLFFAVINGFGNLGIVVEATHQLTKRERPVHVETRFEKQVGVEGLAKKLRPDTDPDLAKCVVLALHKNTVRQLYATSRYTSGSWLKRILLYKPIDALRIFVEKLAYLWPWFASFTWNIGFLFILRTDIAYRDPLRDFTFFTDGNVEVRANILRKKGRYRMLEQTFIVPEEGDLEGFINAVSSSSKALGLHPLLFDVTWLPEDDAFLLSSTRQMAGYAVNIAFVGMNDTLTQSVKDMFTELSEVCFKTGGRIHLTKNIFTQPQTLRAMYEEPLKEFLDQKARIDPTGMFGSGFLERVMGLT